MIPCNQKLVVEFELTKDEIRNRSSYILNLLSHKESFNYFKC